MESDTSSSSVKRSASEGPASGNGLPSPESPALSTPVISHQASDIDEYMAEQGESDSFDTTTPNLPASSQTHNYAMINMSPLDKVAFIKQQRGRSMVIGETWYLIARPWYKRWSIACEGIIDKDGKVEEKDLGPVDNTPLLDKDGNVVSSLLEGVDVEFVPQHAWDALVTWYGEPSHSLPRTVIARGILHEPVLELRPPRLKALLLQDTPSEKPIGPPHPYVTMSTTGSVKELSTALVKAVSIRTNAAYRIWKVEPGDFDGLQYPAAKLAQDGAVLLDDNDQSLEDACIEPDDPFVIEFQENGNWIVDASRIPKSNASSSLASPNGVPPPLFSSDDDFFSRLGNKLPSAQASQSTPTLSAPFQSLKSSKKAVQDPGTLGLGNMGNTCFMNSALQCLAHLEELTDYFISGVYQDELNPDNPLGMHGAIAEAFGSLLQRIWATNSPSTSYSPREFKQQLQRFAPQFSGYQQHDSQELVAFLLDGLHEDLNRVLKKPYVEKPDWEGGGDLELAQLAQKSWEGYMQRNDSVIVDLFQGQYQSTLVCPECQKVSITFDPFMYLTLPLPVQKKWRHTVFYVPWDISKPHVRVPVEIGRDASFKELRILLGRWMGTKPENLLTLEIFSNRFYKNLDDSILCGEMSDNDVIVCFELPCNSRQGRSYKAQNDDPFIFPVILTDVPPIRPAYNYNRGPTMFGYPFIVVIDQEQAKSLDAIYEAVVLRLQRWTVNARDLFKWQVGSSASTEHIPIHITSIPPIDNLTEITENGEILAVEEPAIEEGDITDQKNIVIQEGDLAMDTSADDIPHIVGPKKDIFNLLLQINYKDYGAGFGAYGSSSQRNESWETRIDNVEEGTPLLREGDAFFCEFDENMKAYYFGDDHSRWEHARWDQWEEFTHHEYTDAKQAAADQKLKGISLNDCLAEFTKEEQLGEDDLWYCPQCKKHQQATKKFDLWKAPDILVVHLKRFSNSRALRDKIDTFVDFPIQGLHLEHMIGERKIATKLAESGVDTRELGLDDLDEPLTYDLFAVDEHLGGLGGGHYRAYALNHITDKWYHFDDSYVTPARSTEAVNANAYLLFYRRRSSKPLGGKSHEKIQQATAQSPSPSPGLDSVSVQMDNRLPTPPSESGPSSKESPLRLSNSGWLTPQSKSKSSPSSSPPPLDDIEPPTFEESGYDDILQTSLDPLSVASHQFDFPDPSYKTSPTSSNEAELDEDDEDDDHDSDRTSPHTTYRGRSPSLDVLSTSSPGSNMNPFSDENEQQYIAQTDKDSDDIPSSVEP
ncbi:hypothetical protein SERLA73DRAFT_111301 [Serpula lacrymans var. lacrymans S7.3]|uniref:ubiquitinyl hydrolase 1 n=1 Tax=Serpula lacrymans var. lacrymans (strain S7.3) TaxID=936435 RepID=F8Q527_SERL3|nr:hypothetical protein SERLA73DRAFT_111301 [Serpula lacrymans var. lacrymans S7.3]